MGCIPGKASSTNNHVSSTCIAQQNSLQLQLKSPLDPTGPSSPMMKKGPGVCGDDTSESLGQSVSQVDSSVGPVPSGEQYSQIFSEENDQQSQERDTSSRDEYCCTRRLGVGHFGTVYLAVNTKGTRVAIKQIHAAKEKSDNGSVEVDMLQRCLGHPCIVQLVTAVPKSLTHMKLQQQHTCIITEYIEGSHWGSSAFSQRQGSVPLTHKRLNHIRGILRDILLALHHLHDVVGIAHMDIKPENIMVLNHTTTNQGKEDSADLDPPGRYAKLIDLGSAIPLQVGDDGTTAMTSNTAGTFYFCSPEKLSSPYYCPKKADVWALGVTAAVAIFDDPNVPFPTAVTQSRSCFKRYVSRLTSPPECMSTPYEGNDDEDSSSSEVVPDSLEFPPMMSIQDDDLTDMLRLMTKFHCRLRPTCSELLAHRFILGKTNLK